MGKRRSTMHILRVLIRPIIAAMVIQRLVLDVITANTQKMSRSYSIASKRRKMDIGGE
jgi:hypothetical protein